MKPARQEADPRPWPPAAGEGCSIIPREKGPREKGPREKGPAAEPLGPFVIVLSRLNEGEGHLELVGSGADLDVDPKSVSLTGPVFVRASLYRMGEKVEVQGTLTASIDQVCDRCLAPVQSRIQTGLRIFAERRENRDHRLEEEVREDDVGIVYHDGQRIDLTNEVRQLLLLEVPWHVLCREDCLGLCPRCGANRNETSCSCPEREPDRRWVDLGRQRLDRD